MATWMSHLRLAERLLAEIPDLDAGYFAIGSLAPDCGRVVDGGAHFDPPPEVSHYKKGNSRSGGAVQDLRFVRRFQAELATDHPDRLQRSFLLGYCFHLIADRLWDQDVVVPGRASLPIWQRYSRRMARRIKTDWFGQDLIYARDHPDALFWRVFLGAEYEHDYLDYLPQAMINAKLAYIKALYQRQNAEIQALYQRDYLYGTQHMNAALAQLGDKAAAIYRLIWVDNVDWQGLESATQLLQA